MLRTRTAERAQVAPPRDEHKIGTLQETVKKGTRDKDRGGLGGVV